MRSACIGIASAMVFVVSAVGCGGNGGGSGATAGSGGSSSAGGTPGTGGSTGKGGAVGTGGSSNSGGGSGGAGGGTSITGLGGDKPLGSLNPSDAAQLCSDAYAYFAKAINQADLCKWAGLSYGTSSSPLSDAALQQNCASQETTCLKADPAAADCTAIPSSCNATVSQYSACIVDQAAAFNEAVSALPGCVTVTKPDLQGVWAYLTADLPASCTAITDKCPTMDFPTPRPGTSSSGSGGSGGAAGSGGSGGSTGAGGSTGSGGSTGAGGSTGSGGSTRAGGSTGSGGSTRAGGSTGSGGTTSLGGSGGSAVGSGGSNGQGGSGGSTTSPPGGLPGDAAKAAGTPMVAAHSMTRAMFASYTGPLFKAQRVSDTKEQDIGIVPATGLVDLSALSTFCSGTTCKVATLYDQSGSGNDMWKGDTAANAPMDGSEAPKLCQLLDIEYWQMSDGTKIPIALGRGWGAGEEWTRTPQCLRNRDKTKNMPTGSSPQTTYGIFHQKYVNPGCCFNYGNTGKKIHYTGPGTLSALNFSKVSYWSKGTGSGPWVVVDWETGVYAGNIAKCNSGAAAGTTAYGCTATGENPNPTVTHDIVTALFKHDGTAHWQGKNGNAKSGALAVSFDLPTLPKGGYSPLKQEGGLGLGEGGAGDSGGSGGFSEGAVIAGETTDATDEAIQKSIVSVYGK